MTFADHCLSGKMTETQTETSHAETPKTGLVERLTTPAKLEIRY
jgi:hypothetical protein